MKNPVNAIIFYNQKASTAVNCGGYFDILLWDCFIKSIQNAYFLDIFFFNKLITFSPL